MEKKEFFRKLVYVYAIIAAANLTGCIGLPTKEESIAKRDKEVLKKNSEVIAQKQATLEKKTEEVKDGFYGMTVIKEDVDKIILENNAIENRFDYTNKSVDAIITGNYGDLRSNTAVVKTTAIPEEIRNNTTVVATPVNSKNTALENMKVERGIISELGEMIKESAKDGTLPLVIERYGSEKQKQQLKTGVLLQLSSGRFTDERSAVAYLDQYFLQEINRATGIRVSTDNTNTFSFGVLLPSGKDTMDYKMTLQSFEEAEKILGYENILPPFVDVVEEKNNMGIMEKRYIAWKVGTYDPSTIKQLRDTILTQATKEEQKIKNEKIETAELLQKGQINKDMNKLHEKQLYRDTDKKLANLEATVTTIQKEVN